MVSPFVKQSFVTFGQALTTFQIAVIMSYTSTLLPDLRKPESSIPVNYAQESWIASVLSLSQLCSLFVTPIFVGKCGRKKASLIGLVPLFFSWFFFVFAKNITCLIIGRIIQGFSLAIFNTVASIFIGETSSPKNRGAFLMCVPIAMIIGTSSGHLLGAVVAWWKNRAIIIICIVFTNIVIVILTPESPIWLIDKGRHEEGRRIFRWYRGDQEDDELEKLIKVNRIQRAKAQLNTNEKSTPIEIIKSFFKYLKRTAKLPEFYKPLVIMFHMQLIIVVSGTIVYAAFGQDLFTFTLGNKINVHVAISSVNIQRVISGIFGLFLVRKVNRRSLLIPAVSLNIFCYFAIAGYVYAKSIRVLSELPYLGLVLVHSWFFFVSVGAFPIPMVIGGEIFSLRFKSFSQLLCQLVYSLALFFVLKSFIIMVNKLGMHGTYCVYGGIILYALLMSLIYLPETKGKTLQEIEEIFRGYPLDTAEGQNVGEGEERLLQGKPETASSNISDISSEDTKQSPLSRSKKMGI